MIDMRNGSRWALLSLVLLGGCTNSFGEDATSAGGALAAPSGLAGVPAGGPISLTWTDNSSNETGFRLEVHSGAFGAPPYLDVVMLPANTTATSFAGPPNTTLHFRVYALTASTQSEPSNEITVLTPNVPAAVNNFTALAVSFTRVELQWVSPGNVTGFRLERYDGSTSSFTFITNVGPGVTSYLDTLPYVIPSQLPVHRITPFNANGSGVARAANGMTYWTAFTSTTAASPGSFDSGMYTSMAINGADEPMISFYDPMLRQLWFTKFSGGFWNNSLVMSGIGAGYEGTALALDRFGGVNVAGVDYGSGLVYFNTSATGAPGTWSSTSIDTSFNKRPQLKIWQGPSYDFYHLLYHYDAGYNTFRHAFRESPSGGWMYNTIPISVHTESVPGLAVDASGEAHIILSTTGALYHWSPTGGFDQIPVTGGPFEHSSVVADGAGALHVAFNDAATGRLMYAMKSGGTWTVQVAHAHSRGNLGRHNSIVVDGSGTVFISYYDAVWRNLWHARKQPGQGEFARMLVAEAADVGRFTSTALSSGSVVTSCYELQPSGTPWGFLKVYWLPR